MDIKKFVLSYYNNATRDFHIARITKPTGAFSLHNHNYFQIYYVISGNFLHHVENSIAKLAPGDVFILPPELPHYIEAASGETDFYSMSFTPDFFQSTNENNKLLLDFLYYLKTESTRKILPKLTLTYEDSVFVEVLLKRILGEFSGQKTGNSEIIKESVSVILSVLARVYFEEKVQVLNAEENRELVMHCIGYINNHFDEEITLTEMAQLSAMSKTSFCAIFTAMTGTTFKDYLNRRRIEKATQLLGAGERISAACIRCGYNDLSTFYRNFKRYMGLSPREFVRKYIKKQG